MVRDLQARHAILDLLPMGVVILDAKMRVIYWNSCLETWTGIGRAKLLGKDIRQRFVGFCRRRYTGRLQQLCTGGPPALFSSQLHPHLIPAPLPSGRMRVLNTLAVPVPTGEEGQFHALLAIQDVSNLADAIDSLRRTRKAAERLAATDPLTEVANRRQFFVLAAKAIARARRRSEPCSLLMIDLDGFKETNDRYGHATGDEVLCRLVEVLERILRQEDLIARIGGDEFAVLLQSTDSETARALADRVRRTATEERVMVGDHEVGMRISIGVAGFDPAMKDVGEFLHRADVALYQAKLGGRDRVASE